MHYDKKICLALGILLVGVVAALFFRNESGAGQQAPKLADAKSIDARIADKSVRPYDASPPSESLKQPTVVSNGGNVQPQFTFDGFNSDRGKVSGFARPVEFTQLGPPEPIKPQAAAGTQLAQAPDPNPNDAWTATGTSTSQVARKTRNVSRTTSAGMRSYRVKKGDTLSGIALKFLGTSRRYNEIYKANRDVLRTPNSLREGMILRIPERQEARPSANDPIAKTSRKRNSRASSRRRIASAPNTPTISDKRFIPVRRSPFLLGRRNGFVSRYSNNAPPPSTAGNDDRKPVTILPPPSGKPHATTGGQRPRTYVVRKGDSLERIARKVYGTRRATGKILDANRDRLKDANHLRAGMKIVLP
jgi:nucleoid-associated protein YgaU